jgi:hypothetical protein
MATTPEFVYEGWCEAVRRRGNSIGDKWLSSEGKTEFLARPEVLELAQHPSWVILSALGRFTKISEVLLEAQRQSDALEDSQRQAMTARLNPEPNANQTKSVPTPSPVPPKPAARNDSPAQPPTPKKTPQTKPAASKKVTKKPKQLFSNTDEYYSAAYGHQPHSRSTPTFSAALCPACGQIEDGCPCSR